MNNPTQNTAHGNCCSEVKCESGLRNNYFEGKHLTADSFQVEQKYMLERRRRLNRAVHGWGVVNGYAVTQPKTNSADQPKTGSLTIGGGLALDEFGRELLHAGAEITVKDLLNENGKPFDPKKETSEWSECWQLSVHYAEEKMGLVKIKDPCHQCECDEWNHICETVCFSLTRKKCEECCADFPCQLKCGCGTGRCCDESPDHHDQPPRTDQAYLETRQEGGADNQQAPPHENHEAGEDRRPAKRSHGRGGCRCLCDHLTELEFPSPSKLQCRIEDPCGRIIEADLKSAVPLACLRLVEDDNGCWTFTDLDPCGPRPLVKRNDLLFDLIRGCDLTRIERAEWLDLLHPDPRQPDSDSVMEYKDFADHFSPWGGDERKYVSKIFGVRFSGPVRKDTLRPACFAMTAIAAESEGGWRRMSRVPIIGVDTDDPDAAGHVREARIVVKGSWLRDAVRGEESIFYRQRVRIEFEVRGDMILDCNGQAVDADTHGFSLLPTGNGTPGGTLLSAFRVTRRAREDADEID